MGGREREMGLVGAVINRVGKFNLCTGVFNAYEFCSIR